MGRRGTTATIGADQCWELAASEPVGRLGMVADGRPYILPVNHMITHGKVYFRTTIDGLIARNVEGATVTFEVDHIFIDDWSAWSVEISGTARQVDDSPTLDLLWTPTRPHPWAVGERSVWIEILGSEVSGRMVRA